MWLLILEALAALAVLAFAVWWTMFSGRRRDTEAQADDKGGQADVDDQDDSGPPAPQR